MILPNWRIQEAGLSGMGLVVDNYSPIPYSVSNRKFDEKPKFGFRQYLP